jgi:hypothetical protein
MSSEAHEVPQPQRDTVEMPRPNVWPMVLGLGVVLLAAGVALHYGFLIAGVLIFAAGLTGWIVQLLPGRGHHHEELVEPSRRPQPVAAAPGTIEPLHPGRPGYRFQLPEKVHPISAGVKGGLVGGLVMPIPALAYGIISGHIWYPVNLLAGMVIPFGKDANLTDFNPTYFIVALLIHVVNSVIFGLLYGVLLPTLPDIPRPLAWGGLLMPLLWTGVSFTVMGSVNLALAKDVKWPWFIFSQFLFGLTTAIVVMRLRNARPLPAGLAGGLAGGALMPLPAVLWSLANRHGLWYPINLLAGMVVAGMDKMHRPELEQFHADWLATAVAIHVLLSVSFGLVYAFLLPKLPAIPTSIAWGGLLMPLLWTGVAYSLMGVVNKVLQDEVRWPWFIVSQFVFGIAAAVVVHRSEKIPAPPVGRQGEGGTDGGN